MMVNKNALWAKWVCTAAMGAVLVACGGGGGDSGSNSGVGPDSGSNGGTNSGTTLAANGYVRYDFGEQGRVRYGTVQLRCASGFEKTVDVFQTSEWVVSGGVPEKAFPCLVQASGGRYERGYSVDRQEFTPAPMLSVLERSGSIFVTPFTDLVVAVAAGPDYSNAWFERATPAQITEVAQRVQSDALHADVQTVLNTLPAKPQWSDAINPFAFAQELSPQYQASIGLVRQYTQAVTGARLSLEGAKDLASRGQALTKESHAFYTLAPAHPNEDLKGFYSGYSVNLDGSRVLSIADPRTDGIFLDISEQAQVDSYGQPYRSLVLQDTSTYTELDFNLESGSGELNVGANQRYSQPQSPFRSTQYAFIDLNNPRITPVAMHDGVDTHRSIGVRHGDLALEYAIDSAGYVTERAYSTDPLAPTGYLMERNIGTLAQLHSPQGAIAEDGKSRVFMKTYHYADSNEEGEFVYIVSTGIGTGAVAKVDGQYTYVGYMD